MQHICFRGPGEAGVSFIIFWEKVSGDEHKNIFSFIAVLQIGEKIDQDLLVVSAFLS